MTNESWALLDRPMFVPHKCIVTHYADDPEGFVDCQTEIDGLRVAIAVGTIRRLAAFAGINDRRIDELETERLQLRGRIAEMEREINTANAALDAVDALKRTGQFTAHKRPKRQAVSMREN